MIDLIIIGTIGLDDIETPFGRVKGALGGSGAYASCAASFFTQPGLISIAGVDLPQSKINLLKKRGVDLSGVEKKGKNFRWSGSYEFDMNSAKTLKTELNSLVDFNPLLPKEYKQAKFVFLANVDPALQMKVLDQLDTVPHPSLLPSEREKERKELPRPVRRERVGVRDMDGEVPKPFVMVDTMNYWIESKKQELLQVIERSDLVVMNEGEARELFRTPNLIKAGRLMLELGPKYAIIKKGEHGALLFSDGSFFSAPGYPLEDVCDPTGAGDTFAGALIGYLSMVYDQTPGVYLKESDVRKAVIYGSAAASFCAEDFSLGYLDQVNLNDIEERFKKFREIREF